MHNGHMPHLRLRVMRDTDIPAVTELNRSAVPTVNDLTEDQVRELHAMCDIALVSTNAAGQVMAFVLSLCPGSQ